jgi:stage II sporulation protein Q
MNNWKFTVNTKNEVRTVKNKIVDVVFKKFQSYSFIIFLALIVVAFIIIAQLNRSEDAPVDTQPKNTQPTNQPADEVFKLPIDAESPQVARNFWHSELSTEEQYQAIIKVGNTFRHNTGIDYTIDKETEFNVLASLSGTVSKVNQDSLLGYVVEIEHLDGIKTSYSSLGSVDVAVGDKVKQGDILGKAGSNNFDQASGVHVHFEVLKGAIKLNPNELIGMKISEINYE